ncbi:B3 domain-containing protein At3g06220-like [Henckelia pumila]|uniref:B3 domain-containing protein At3g06220-like n=1 Tax=Henckelia pumila TaxID=405737 RepID=UPI003C6E4DD1
MSLFLMGPGSSQPSKPSFFKVLIDQDFTRQLRLPTVFVREHKESLAEKAVIRASSGESWVVKLEHTDDGKYFTRGWSKFAEDMRLEMGEFLVFWFAGNSTFDVLVYRISGCCRRVVSSGEKADVSNKRVKITGSLEKDGSPLYFEIVLGKHHLSRVCLSVTFVKMSGLIKRKRVLLEYVPKQHFASAAVRLRPKSRVELAWPGFVQENHLVYGSTYYFEFDPEKKVIKIDEIKK